jgi:sialate O-acetylesterase
MDMQRSVHPGRKDINGIRASEIALSEVYKVTSPTWRAPEFSHATFAEGAATVHFDHVADGFSTRGGDRINGFVLAGADQVFHWAYARIEGETIVVTSPQVPEPIAVRYAFAYKQAPWANLFGANDRPVLIFRSDDWIDVP